MAIVEEKKEKAENASQEGGCCGGTAKQFSGEAVKADLQKGESCSTRPLDVKVEKKDKEQGSSCCG